MGCLLKRIARRAIARRAIARRAIARRQAGAGGKRPSAGSVGVAGRNSGAGQTERRARSLPVQRAECEDRDGLLRTPAMSDVAMRHEKNDTRQVLPGGYQDITVT